MRPRSWMSGLRVAILMSTTIATTAFDWRFSLARAILGPIFGAHLGRISCANVDRPVDFAKIASSGVCQADADRHSGPRYVAASLATGLLNMAIRGYILGAISGPILDDFAAG